MKVFFNFLCVVGMVGGCLSMVAMGVNYAIGLLNAPNMPTELKGVSVLGFILLAGIVLSAWIVRSFIRNNQ